MRCDVENSLSVYQDIVGFMMDARPRRGIRLIYVASHKVWPVLQSAEGHSTDDRTSRVASRWSEIWTTYSGAARVWGYPY
jgi:hypothetical protein